MTTASPTFWQRHWQKIIAGVFWAGLVIGYIWYTQANNLSPLEAAQRLTGFLEGRWGFLLYTIFYMIRPLIFAPATLLTLVGGSVFGAFWGLIYTVIGANASAMVAYLIGYFFGENIPIDRNDSRLSRYIQRMRDNSFETIMTMRFIFIPYDLVNYAAGILKIHWKPFLLATILGSLPGTLTFVLLGSSVKGDLANADLSLNPWTLVASAAIFVVSLGLSRYLRKSEGRKQKAE